MEKQQDIKTAACAACGRRDFKKGVEALAKKIGYRVVYES